MMQNSSLLRLTERQCAGHYNRAFSNSISNRWVSFYPQKLSVVTEILCNFSYPPPTPKGKKICNIQIAPNSSH